jgi:hypothetical protein
VNSSGGASVLDAWITKDIGNGWSIQSGQFKTLTWQEWTVSETRQAFIERSLLDARYGVSYTQGVAAHYSGDDFRFHAQFSDGTRTLNTPYNTAAADSALYQPNNEYAFAARVEWKASGEWSDYADFEGWRGGTGLIVVGGGASYQKGEFGSGTEENEILQWTLDGTFKFDGANIFAAVIGTHVDNNVIDSRDEIGILVQGGYFIADDMELMARYEWGDLDGAGGSVGDDLNILTFGFNKFWNKHGLKFTSDVGYAFDSVSAAWGGASRGWNADAVDQDGQVVVRAQINLLF